MEDYALTFARWTDRTRRALELAEQETRQGRLVGTGHLLIGFLAEGECVAYQALARHGITLELARQWLPSAREGSPDPGSVLGKFPRPYTEHLWQSLRTAERESLRLGHTWIGTEHLLGGILEAAPGGDAYKILDRCNVRPWMLAGTVRELLEGYTATALAAGPAAPPGPAAAREEALRVLVTACLRYAAAQYAPRADCGPGTEITRDQIESAVRRLYQAIETDADGPRPAGWEG